MTHPAVWNTRLQCKIYKLQYDFFYHHGKIWLPTWECCDTEDCIELFMNIDANVIIITIYAGNNPDMILVRSGDTWAISQCGLIYSGT